MFKKPKFAMFRRKEQSINPNAVVNRLPVQGDQDWESIARREVLTAHGAYFRRQTLVVLEQAGIRARGAALEVGPRYLSVGVRLSDATQLSKAMKLSNSVGYAAGLGDGSPEPPVIAVPLGYLLHYQFQLPPETLYHGRRLRLWQNIFVSDPRLVNTGLGIGASNLAVRFTWEDAPHALVAGMTDAGKSTLLRTIMYQITQTWGPDQVKLGIIDPNRDYEDFDNHASLLAPIARTPEQIKELIAHFAVELVKRQQTNQRSGPRWVLVMDESDSAYVLGGDNSNLELVQSIGLGGRAFLVNLIVGTHKPDNDSIGALKDALDNRFLGKFSTSSTSGQIGAGLDLHKLTSQGDFVHSARARSLRFLAAQVPSRLLRNMPRAEILPLESVDLSLLQNLNVNYNQLRPEKLAYYLYNGVDAVTDAEALQALDLPTLMHQEHQKFAREIAVAYKRLEDNV